MLSSLLGMSKTAERTLNLLELIARAGEPQGLLELAAEADLDKTTASRLLAFLEDRAFVVRDTGTRHYRVGSAFIALAAMATQHANLPALARSHLERLRDESEETVSFHVPTKHERVCVAGAESPHVLQRILTIGEPVALWLGPSSKVILAFLPIERQESLLQMARASGSDIDHLRTQLEQTRTAGMIVTASDRTPEVSAVSVPVFDATGIAASITISGPVHRWTNQRIAQLEPALRAAARDLTEQIGGRVP
jgi:DNA-binding IclR family transcriptional regulator